MASLHAFLTGDHERLDALLDSALRDDGTIDNESYSEFRAGILRHIGMEERVLFPEIRKREGDSDLLKQLHRDHAAIAALLVPPPTRAEIEAIRELLVLHNPLEEEPGGLYDLVEELEGDDLAHVIARVQAIPPIPLAPHVDTELTRRTIEQLLREAAAGRQELRSKK